MDAISEEFNEYISRRKQSANETLAGIDSFINLLSDAKNSLQEAVQTNSEGAPISKATLCMLAAQTKTKSQQLIDLQKQDTALLNKVSKTIEKKFSSSDIEWNPKAFEGKESSLLYAIIQHFFREGEFDISQALLKASGLDEVGFQDNQFHRMYEIINDLRHQRLSSAIEWATEHRSQLQQIDSSLLFELHKQAYLQILQSTTYSIPLSSDPAVLSALNYAQVHFSSHLNHFKEIQHLLGSLLYLGRPLTPYSIPYTWKKVESMFSRAFCSVLGFSPESPLFTVMMVGTTALPTIMRMAAIMKEKKNEWSAENELPVEIPLLPMHRFHSVFACPVSREQGSEKNPPMMMPCAHTICNESLKKLSRNGSTRFKCPYCPSESTASQALRVYL
ncbi:hypothetical protein HMI54_005655 [Coelomomyces lativittatus]|nr:hypothetical protein HMI56_004360 [Coelomomyces lativittatus]KAJ1517424.1 hypothetical protein HMI54_005655 [Coelomomyces lativittatus]KAJ1518213.1 hypothetical protein HMI55_001494 [Coelomomyces lativittatus]